nr:alpha/beta fold hydrolase [Halopseudomonas xinjiangensis]
MSLRFNEPKGDTAGMTLLLAHGAGAPMDSPFMDSLASALAERGMRIARFEFPYMADRRQDGRKRPPNPMARLKDAFREAAASLDGPVVLAGKSMGGRVASMLGDEVGAAAIVCFGYPFHPPGKPERMRTEHLQHIATPTLIVQGTRDPFGKPDEVSGYMLGGKVRVEWLETGDHDFRPLKASGLSQQILVEQAADASVRFCTATLR